MSSSPAPETGSHPPALGTLPELVRRQRALTAFFLIPGVAMASWVTRTPAIRDSIHASLSEMGLVLLGLSLGSLIGVLGSGRVVSRIGTRATSVTGLWLTVMSLITITLGSAFGSAITVAAGLALFGLGLGMCEISINIDGAELERQIGRSVMHVLHGSYSLGTLLGALIGLALNALHVPIAIHLLAVAALVSPAIIIFSRDVPGGFGISITAATRTPTRTGPPLWRDPRLLLIGFIAFGMALTEGTANDWLPIIMVDEHGASETFGAFAFLVFAACMTLGRLGGGAFVDRIGRSWALRLSALLAALGIALAAFGHGPVIAGIAAVLWGIGTSLAFPLAISAAGESEQDAAQRVQLVAVLGYIALLVGPPLLGFVGEHAGMRTALVLVLGLVAAVIAASPAIGKRTPRPPQ